MKTNLFKSAFILLTVSSVLLTSCSKNDDDLNTSQTAIILSTMDNDGYIENTTVKTVFTSDFRLKIGWEAGYATRSFLSFNISVLQPTSADKILVIDKAVLKVYEQNTNMLPFTEGATRVVETYLVNYGTLDASDYSGETVANCGTIATTGFSVLTEHPLNVTTPVSNYVASNTSVSDLQFRLQFTNNDNVTIASTLYNAMWCVYSGENQDNSLNAYRPVLVVTYHFNTIQ
jgi:major membrane immunogen (membrane-anchored lipoprotein)